MPQSPVGIAALIVSFVPNKSPSAAKDGYQESLIHFIQMTQEHEYKHVAADASLVTSVAQRVDHKLNIKASIE
jgi:hypothetical protein